MAPCLLLLSMSTSEVGSSLEESTARVTSEFDREEKEGRPSRKALLEAQEPRGREESRPTRNGLEDMRR